jgi:hypothetical protein
MHGRKSTGATEYWQTPTSPDCLTVNVRLAIVMVPVRVPASELRATVYDTVPLPDPSVPELTVSQEALLTAVQEQSPGALTLTLPVAASLPNSALSEESA